MIPRAAKPAAVLVLLAVLAAGCASPSRTSTDYQRKAYATTQAAQSAVATAGLVATAGAHGDAWRAFLDATITRSETELSSVASTFDSVQPPTTADDALRDTVDKALQGAQQLLAQMRIRLRRYGPAALKPFLPQVQPVEQALSQAVTPA